MSFTLKIAKLATSPPTSNNRTSDRVNAVDVNDFVEIFCKIKDDPEGDEIGAKMDWKNEIA